MIQIKETVYHCKKEGVMNVCTLQEVTDVVIQEITRRLIREIKGPDRSEQRILALNKLDNVMTLLSETYSDITLVKKRYTYECLINKEIS